MSARLHVTGVPVEVGEIVTLLCQDYRIRSKKHTLPEDYAFAAIITEALSGCGEGIREVIFDDICERRGYWCSPINYMISKSAYYIRKKEVIRKIAKSLHLI